MATQKKPDIFLNMLFRPGGKSGIPPAPWPSVLDINRPRSFEVFLPRYQQVRVTIFTDAQRLSAQQQSLHLKRRKHNGRGGMSSSSSGAEFGPTYLMSYQALSQSAVGMSSLAPSQTAALVGQSQYLDGDENGESAPEPEENLNKAMEKDDDEEDDEESGNVGSTQSNGQEFAPWSGESSDVEEEANITERRETEVHIQPSFFLQILKVQISALVLFHMFLLGSYLESFSSIVSHIYFLWFYATEPRPLRTCQIRAL